MKIYTDIRLLIVLIAIGGLIAGQSCLLTKRAEQRNADLIIAIQTLEGRYQFDAGVAYSVAAINSYMANGKKPTIEDILVRAWELKVLDMNKAVADRGMKRKETK